MNRLEVRFDRVFDVVQASWWPDTRFTHFGFEASGKRFVDVSVPGWTKVEAGMTVAALLGNANDWRTLVGWVDCSSGHIACEKPYPHLAASLLLVFFFLVFLFRANEDLWLATSIASVVFGGGALFYLYRFAKALLIQRELLSIKKALGANVCGG